MAFNLPHNMSLQQLTELQEASSRFSDRPMETDHGSLRHMLQKSRGEQQQAAEDLDRAGATTSGATTSLMQPEQSAPLQDEAAAGADGEETKEFEDKTNSSSGNKQLQDGTPATTATATGAATTTTGPTWLSNAVFQRQASASASAPNYSQWLSMPQPQASTDLGDVAPGDTPRGLSAQQQQQQQQSHGSVEMNTNNNSSGAAKGFLELHADTANSGGDLVTEEEGGIDSKLWQNARLKADLVTHPLYEQLLSAHISCLRTATPVDQLPKIDAQLAHSHQVAAKYSILANDQGLSKDKDEVNEFMAHYVTLLRSFKEQLQQHVRVHAMEAVVACWELEQSLFTLTGVSPGEGTGATMSEDEDEQADSDSGYYDAGLDGHDFTGFGPLIPTETERTLMERVRHELKIELKQGYKAKINDVREEILRKRRAGKLPGDTTSVLKSWWHAHSKWPYPSEDDKARLVQETGLELKQINNWFINQRKRNWHSNPSSSTSLKNKRKR